VQNNVHIHTCMYLQPTAIAFTSWTSLNLILEREKFKIKSYFIYISHACCQEVPPSMASQICCNWQTARLYLCACVYIYIHTHTGIWYYQLCNFICEGTVSLTTQCNCFRIINKVCLIRR
jgi:hypothetical protein